MTRIHVAEPTASSESFIGPTEDHTENHKGRAVRGVPRFALAALLAMENVMAIANPLGLRGNDPSQPVRVEAVANGLACDCYCAKCGGRFVAVQNAKTPHFRHYNCDDCGGSFETAVHLLTKQVLAETKTLMLPYLKVRPDKRLWKVGSRVTQEICVVEQQCFRFDRVEDEVWMNGRIPDIVMWKGDRKLLVEIVVTHQICEEKLNWIRENNLSVVEVNMAWANYKIEKDGIRKALHDGAWLVALLD